jgi:spore germination protein KA
MILLGSIVLGQAAVEAKLVGAPVIIVTAFSGITTLMNPTQTGPTIIIRTALLLGASVLGIYGLIFVSILVVLHLMNLRSFGIPYMLNLTSAANYDGQDIWVRAPWWSMKLRPKLIGARNFFRQSPTGSRVK